MVLNVMMDDSGWLVLTVGETVVCLRESTIENHENAPPPYIVTYKNVYAITMVLGVTELSFRLIPSLTK